MNNRRIYNADYDTDDKLLLEIYFWYINHIQAKIKAKIKIKMIEIKHVTFHSKNKK